MKESGKTPASLAFPRSKKGEMSLILIIFGALGWVLLGQFVPQQQYIGAAFLNYGLMIGGIHVVDKWVLTKVDFQKTIQSDPVAVALTFIGHCILIVSSYLVAALPFFR